MCVLDAKHDHRTAPHCIPSPILLLNKNSNGSRGGFRIYLGIWIVLLAYGHSTVKCDEILATTRSLEALFMRGRGSYHGEHGFEQTYTNALRTFLQDAETGHHADAAVSAGAMLHQGVGGKGDQRRAFELYHEARKLGTE